MLRLGLVQKSFLLGGGEQGCLLHFRAFRVGAFSKAGG